MKVAEFRRITEAALDQANCHYHACVGAREVENWKVIGARVLAKVEAAECARANADDREWHRKAVAMLKEKIAQADERIAAYNAQE